MPKGLLAASHLQSICQSRGSKMPGDLAPPAGHLASLQAAD